MSNSTNMSNSPNISSRSNCSNMSNRSNGSNIPSRTRYDKLKFDTDSNSIKIATLSSLLLKTFGQTEDQLEDMGNVLTAVTNLTNRMDNFLLSNAFLQHEDYNKSIRYNENLLDMGGGANKRTKKAKKTKRTKRVKKSKKSKKSKKK